MLGDNQSGNLDGTFTELEFCLFREAGAGTDVQSAFPDLGFHYGVFHDFEGFQPPWVVAKFWRRSDDEGSSAPNSYTHRGPDGPRSEGAEVDALKRMVEDAPGNDTVFDLTLVN